MINRTHTLARLALGVTVVAGLAAVAMFAPAPQATAAPVQQAMTCTWQNIGSSQNDLFHGGEALDSDQDIAYWYGGVDSTFTAQSKVEKSTFTGPPPKAAAGAQPAGGALALLGSSAAYRAKGAKADGSAAYYFGGMKDWTDGKASNDVQRFITKTSTWQKVAVPTGNLLARAFSTAAYDPVHDVIWVMGGVTNCKLADVEAGQGCQSTSLAIQYLTFDATTGDPKEWKNLGVNTNVFAGTAAYDSMGKRVILQGGTTDIKSGKNTLQALNLSDPDPAKATLATLTATGTGPSVYYHGGVYDSNHNWFVTYGGVKQNFMQTNESTDTSTMALDLGQTPPKWMNLSPQGTPGERVAGALVYDAKVMAVIQILGRQKITYNSATPPVPTPKVSKVIQALTCNAAATNTPPGPTLTPGPSPTGGVKTPTPVGPPTATIGPPIGKACPGLETKVPAVVIAEALANPDKVNGWGQLCNPGLPPSPWNILRTYLSLTDPGKPYNALFNGVEYKCGCP